MRDRAYLRSHSAYVSTFPRFTSHPHPDHVADFRRRVSGVIARIQLQRYTCKQLDTMADRRRQQEIEEKRAKIAELRRAREERKAQQEKAAAEVSPVPSS